MSVGQGNLFSPIIPRFQTEELGIFTSMTIHHMVPRHASWHRIC